MNVLKIITMIVCLLGMALNYKDMNFIISFGVVAIINAILLII